MGISGNEINYRGVDIPLPQPFLIRPCDFIPIDLSLAPKQSITLPPYQYTGTVTCSTAPSLASDTPIIHAPMGFEASQLPYSMAYGGTLIPVT